MIGAAAICHPTPPLCYQIQRPQAPMPSSVAAADQPTNNLVPIHKISVNDDEKIEVEGENSQGSAPLDHRKDGTRILEPLGLEEHLTSGISTPKPVANPDTPMIEEGNDSCRISYSDERRGRNYSSLDGSKDTTERPAPDCFSDLASSEVQCGENQRLNCDNLHMHEDEDRSSVPVRDIGRETFGYKSYLAGYGSSSPPLLKDDSHSKDSYCSGMLPSSSVLSSYKYLNTEVPSYTSAFDDASYKSTYLMPDYHHLPFLNRSGDRWPSYLTSSSSNLDPVGDQKHLDRSGEYCFPRSMSLHNKSSARPGCGTESFSWTDLSGDTEHSGGYKTKVYFNDWETSAPFRPSTFLSQIIPPPESLYDPIRDSIEQTSIAVQDLAANERKTADRAITHQENVNTSSKEEKHSRSVSTRGQKRKQSKLKKVGASCEIDTDLRRDGSVNFESQVLKHFRAALVEFVKELLKPTWHKGLLMRDAYKMIVKKAVDKIINSLTLDQVPDTTESINQYLSLSKPKVAKLIEGYVEKYGKS